MSQTAQVHSDDITSITSLFGQLPCFGSPVYVAGLSSKQVPLTLHFSGSHSPIIKKRQHAPAGEEKSTYNKPEGFIIFVSGVHGPNWGEKTSEYFHLSGGEKIDPDGMLRWSWLF